jgi:hypothetical protein
MKRPPLFDLSGLIEVLVLGQLDLIKFELIAARHITVMKQDDAAGHEEALYNSARVGEAGRVCFASQRVHQTRLPR